MNNKSCKICRRQGQKLFLKGEKCFSPKCSFIKRPYPPGPQRKRRRYSSSDFAKELSEKQKLKNYYGLSEKQFSRYVKDVLGKRGKVDDATLYLIQNIESRFDNVVLKMGIARSRREARELVSHSHFLVNAKPVNIPSFQLKKGDFVQLKKSKKEKTIFKNQAAALNNYQPPAWLKVNKQKMEAQIVDKPTIEDVGSAVDIPAIFEFYSR